MAKTKLRVVFNVIAALIFFVYICLIWVIDINEIGALIYSVLFFGTLILRDKVAPKKNRSDEDGNN
ncbi:MULTISPECIES: hypothetical protein [Staphylococcus]|jgi:hypothetical protein|uniref:Uncharacterized protein n=2 Tax=Staphylococcus TaxID=1279 RepID=A0A0M2NRH0_STACC|nr:MULTISPECIES: hypothetical protein [Staphylococcus]HCQ3426455.1 hypothetical protein [Staphylococcus aureus]KKI62627.1 hypothetical protein UF66_2188 [Staphylococcus cohnii subsp. cohnii]MBF7026012.1 hypothetical protein [Staphylococcus kloosii]MDW8556143.1 hypothetical protein [Staphylococcus xylosus]PUZ30826.1 hypothetical protein BU606_13185 [Staphylococcus arlettae]